jgi:CheY-like chemotaxis protein
MNNPVRARALHWRNGRGGLRADGEQALHQIEGFDPAVVVLDAEMPVLDGPSTATRLRAIDQASGRPRRLIVGLSAHDDAAMRAAFLDAGCDVVLAKPVTRAALLEAVLACGPAPEPTPGDAPDASEVVGVEADLLPMIPAFLQSRREQAKDLAAALDDEALNAPAPWPWAPRRSRDVGS